MKQFYQMECEETLQLLEKKQAGYPKQKFCNVRNAMAKMY